MGYNLENYELKKGSHKLRENGMCAMEFVAYLNGEPHSDKPQCVSPLITSFIISCNDNWTQKERQLLKPYLLKVIGTRDGKDIERAKIFAMSAVTKITPHAIELIGLKKEVNKMRKAHDLFSASASASASAAAAADLADLAASDAADAALYAAASASAAAYAALYAADAALYAAASASAAAYAALYAAASAAIRNKIIQECLNLLDDVINIK